MTRAVVGLALALLSAPLFAQRNYDEHPQPSANAPAKLPGKVAIAQKLGNQIPLETMFRDERGNVVRLKEYFNHGKPVLLNFVYFNCPMLCPMVLEGLTTAMTELKFDAGDKYEVITVSIDPRDKPEQAAEFKERYIKRYGRLNAVNGWHFLTGPDNAIKALADSVGFQYAYDGTQNQFAHGAALMVLTPQGVLSRYLYGFQYKARDLRLAIAEASGNKVSTPTDQVLLLCYHYDPSTGKYSADAMLFVRAGGVASVIGLGSFIFIMLRRERYDTTPPQDTTSR